MHGESQAQFGPFQGPALRTRVTSTIFTLPCIKKTIVRRLLDPRLEVQRLAPRLRRRVKVWSLAERDDPVSLANSVALVVHSHCHSNSQQYVLGGPGIVRRTIVQRRCVRPDRDVVLLPCVPNLEVVVVVYQAEEILEEHLRLVQVELYDALREAEGRLSRERTMPEVEDHSPRVDKEAFPAGDGVCTNDGVDGAEVGADVVGMPSLLRVHLGSQSAAKSQYCHDRRAPQ